MLDLHSRLRSTRLTRGLSQTKLARLAGVSQPTVANWEAGSQYPRHSAMQNICDALGIELSWLVDGTSDTTTARKDYLTTPIRHVPVYDWPPEGQELQQIRPTTFVPIASETEDLFALTSDGISADPGAILVFETVETTGSGRYLVLSSEDRHTLTDANGDVAGENTLARLHTTVVRHN